jgi:hypothetical protein
MKLFLERGFSLSEEAYDFKDRVLLLGRNAEAAVLVCLSAHGIHGRSAGSVLHKMHPLRESGALNKGIAAYKVLLQIDTINDPLPVSCHDILAPAASKCTMPCDVFSLLATLLLSHHCHRAPASHRTPHTAHRRTIPHNTAPRGRTMFRPLHVPTTSRLDRWCGGVGVGERPSPVLLCKAARLLPQKVTPTMKPWSANARRLGERGQCIWD